MKRVKLLLTFGAIVAILWGLAFIWQESSRSDKAALARTQAELQALRAESERLREAVTALQAAKPAQPAQGAANPVVTPELLDRIKAAVAAQTQPGQGPAVPMTPEQEREDLLRYGEWLENRLQRATAAKDDTAATLKSKVSAVLGEGSALLDLQCSAELCRMKTHHTDLEAYRRFQGRAFQEAEKRVWSKPTTFVVLEEPDDHGRPLLAAIYMSRSDALPSPEPPR